MAAWKFDQVTFFCEEYNNFQDSKLILIIIDFKTFAILLLRQMNVGVFLVQQLIYVYYKRKTPLFFNH